jgi:lipoprotein NlpI
LAPRDAGHYKGRGCSCFSRGNFTAAEADLRYSFNLGDDPYALLFWYVSCGKIGHVSTRELDSRAKRLTGSRWPAAIVELYLGKIGFDAARLAAANSDERAEAEFYIGEWHLMRGNRAEAVTALQDAVKSCPRYFDEYIAAVNELNRLE